MLTRILALVAILLLAPSTLAHANARALSLESASLGFFTPNRDFLKEIPDLTHCCIKEKSTERGESSNRREEYLRARYMDPGLGRFLGMDPWRGCDECPLSKHRFLYASDDPVNRIDPTGRSDLTQQSVAVNSIGNMVGQATFAILRKLVPAAVAFTGLTIHDWIGLKTGFPAVQAKARESARQRGDRLWYEAWIAQSLPLTTTIPPGHHPIPIYLCGADDQNPLVQMDFVTHSRLHSAMYIWGIGVETVLAAEFIVKYPIFSLRNRGAAPSAGSSGWGSRALAQSAPGRSYIAGLLDTFYAAGWYAIVPSLEPSFLRERTPYVSGSKTSLAEDCHRSR